MSTSSFGDLSLSLHKKLHGKIGTSLKTPIETRDDLSTVYTPGVAAVSQEIAANPNSSFLYTERADTVAVISNGTAVLGLGNIGALAAQPVMSGKAALFKAFANVDAVPLVIDEPNTDKLIEIIKSLAGNFGGINLEDIAAPQCFAVEDALQDLGIPVLHDDQHGTAIVVSAALQNAIRALQKTTALTVVVNGAGAGGTAVAKMLKATLPTSTNIIMLDSKGIISADRADLSPEKQAFLSWTNNNGISGDLRTALKNADVFIGLSKGGALLPEFIGEMASEPIIFAMANPTPEIMPDEAVAAGAAIVATGRSDFPNQVNNVLAFPGLFRGALDAKATKFTPRMLYAAIQALVKLVPNPTTNAILPSALDKNVATLVAEAVSAAAILDNVTRVQE